MSYNGWENYETWCVKLWMDNEYGSYQHWSSKAEEIYRDADWDLDVAVSKLADQLKESHEEGNPVEGGLWGDLMTTCLQRVGWREIAESFLEDVEVEEEDEEDEEEEEEIVVNW